MPFVSCWLVALIDDWQNGGFGLYIHWPFCQAKCPYCDFNSHVSANVNQSAWRNALIAEITAHAALVPNRTLNTIFFGGGTPSLMDPDLVGDLIDAARAGWPTSNDVEVTLEANPTSVEAGRFSGYRDAGVNRVSMGIQALSDPDLKALGRLHTVQEARAAYEISRNVFERVSFDLIYGRQNQTMPAWRAELTEALTMAVDHLSLYQLTIEAGTAFGDRYQRGLLKGLPDDDAGADFYDMTQDLCGEADLLSYEVSNYARSGCESRHNQIYWRYGDYVGIGPGAHGRLTLDGCRHASENILNPTCWLEAQSRGASHINLTPLTDSEQSTEYMLMGLRMTDGISLSRYMKILGSPVDRIALADLVSEGFLSVENDRLFATRAGRPLLNAILRQLLSE